MEEIYPLESLRHLKGQWVTSQQFWVAFIYKLRNQFSFYGQQDRSYFQALCIQKGQNPHPVIGQSHFPLSVPVPLPPLPLLSLEVEVGQVLDDLSDECEGPGGLLIRVFLHQAEEAGGHDGRTQEAEEERGTDESICYVFTTALRTAHSP